ncbi:MAG: HDIG domain-containing protein [bacterium]|nr:HDIG domain-containing protein [bacterium]
MRTFVSQDIYPGEFAFHRQYTTVELLLDLVWTHSVIVSEIVIQLLDTQAFDQTQINRPVAIQSALLHDVGTYFCGGFEWMPGSLPSDKPYAQHTVIGAQVLEQAGCHPEVVAAARVHAGVGLTSDDISRFGLALPPGEYVPTTPTQQLVTYASKFHSKTPKFRTGDEVAESLQKYGDDKVATFVQLQSQFGSPNLESIQAKYAEWHRAYQYVVTSISQPTINLNPAGISQMRN